MTANARVDLSGTFGTFDGELAVDSDLSDGCTISLGGSLSDNDGTVDLVGHSVAGVLDFPFGFNGSVSGIDEVSGQINLTGAATASTFNGTLEVASVSGSGLIWASAGDFGGSIDVAEHVAGAIVIDGDFLHAARIEIVGDLEGLLLIGGDLQNDGTASDEITVSGEMGAEAAIVVDYNGWHAGDDWASGATISVDSTSYSQNTPADRIYEVTDCRGDLNNDESVDFFDIDPFLDALDDPETYRDNYPGLYWSVFYHADLGGQDDTCDEVIDGKDSDLLIDRIFENCCSPLCGPGACSFFGGGGPTPEQAAELLESALDPAGLDAWVAGIQAVLATLPQGREQFWADVFAILGYE